MNRILALIVARQNSKRIPRKNLRLLGGKPLIVHTFDAARAAGCLDRVILSTDSPDIADLACRHGIEVPFLRPAALADDRSPVIDTALHALQWLAEHETYVADSVMLLQPTSPFRTASDIDAAVRLTRRVDAEPVVSVVQGRRHPSLNRWRDADGRLRPLSGAAPWDADKASFYALNGALYLVSTPTLLKDRCWCPDGAMAYVMPPERSIDIDTEADFARAELILQERLARRHGLAA